LAQATSRRGSRHARGLNSTRGKIRVWLRRVLPWSTPDTCQSTRKSSNVSTGREHVSLTSQKKRKVATTHSWRRHASRESRLSRSAAIAPWPSPDERFAALAATCPYPARRRALLQTGGGKGYCSSPDRHMCVPSLSSSSVIFLPNSQSNPF
jgi:hypothetical protein